MLKSQLFEFNHDIFTSIKGYNKQKTLVLIRARYKEFVRSLPYLALESTEYNYILEYDGLKPNEKFEIVTVIQPPTDVNINILNNIFKSNLTQQKKIILLNRQIRFMEQDFDSIAILLKSIGSPFADLAAKHGKVEIPENTENYELIKNLHRINYIPSFRKDGAIFKVALRK